MESNVVQTGRELLETLQEIRNVWVIPHLIFHNLIDIVPQMGMLKRGRETAYVKRWLVGQRKASLV